MRFPRRLPCVLAWRRLDLVIRRVHRIAQPVADPVISISGLRKSYGDVEAVRGIDLEVREGEIFAFLGPNGAGKTTCVEILEGY
ncbi:MAG: ATP-binding cassette domain-containing protein, partial [Solirubrobacterales bacterium]